MARYEIVEVEGQKMIRATLENETIRAESGALHYMRGQIEMTSRPPSAGGILKSFVTGETFFKPTYRGTGEVYFGPPIFGEYVILELQNDSWVLDRGAYVCSDMSIEVGAFRNKALSAMLGGEGIFQTQVSGTGKVVIKAPGQVQWLELRGETLSVDGTFAVARSGSLDFSVRRASKSIMGSMTSGEGLLNTFSGEGKVLIAPVPNLYQSLTRYGVGGAAAAGAQGAQGAQQIASMARGGGSMIGCLVMVVMLVFMGIVIMVSMLL